MDSIYSFVLVASSFFFYFIGVLMTSLYYLLSKYFFFDFKIQDFAVFFLFSLLVTLKLILVMFPQEKLMRNRMNLQCQISNVMTIISTRDSLQTDKNTIQMLSSKIDNPLCKFGGIPQGLGENECINNRNINFSTSIKIPFIERLPPFTFSIHLTRCVLLSCFKDVSIYP